jgi:hypothetical protein
MKEAAVSECSNAITLSLSPDNAHDAPCGQELLLDLGPMQVELPMIMDKAYEGDETRQIVVEMGTTACLADGIGFRTPS